ncbi:MAG: hypothetical protein WBF79_00115 [Rhodococcus sp. (in: high G+C Gram-positive bacteria)]
MLFPQTWQVGHRQRRSDHRGRPPKFDTDMKKRRNTIERGFCEVDQWRALATRSDKLDPTFRAGGPTAGSHYLAQTTHQ